MHYEPQSTYNNLQNNINTNVGFNQFNSMNNPNINQMIQQNQIPISTNNFISRQPVINTKDQIHNKNSFNFKQSNNNNDNKNPLNSQTQIQQTNIPQPV